MTDSKVDASEKPEEAQYDDIGSYEDTIEAAKGQQEMDRREAFDIAKQQREVHDAWVLNTDDIGDQIGEPLQEQSDQGEWVKEMRDVKMADLPEPPDIHGPEDFKKDVTPEQMRQGIERLQEMKPLIESGEGASSDYWYNVDQQRSLDQSDGYQRVYDAFYGESRIRLDKDGDQYSYTNGRHRAWVGKQMGIDSLPAEVTERRKQ